MLFMFVVTMVVKTIWFLALQPLFKEIREIKCWFEENKYNEGLVTDVKREFICTNLKGNFIK